MTQSSEATQIVNALGAGDDSHVGRLVELVYEELRRLAGSFLAQEAVGHTLQPTALVNEAFLKLIKQDEVDWQGRSHFLAIGAQAMRRILVDYARTKKRQKRGGGWQRVELTDDAVFSTSRSEDVLALDAALEELARLNPRQARIVELRFFSGMSIDEIAAALGMSKRTVERDWTMVRAWLRHQAYRGVGDVTPERYDQMMAIFLAASQLNGARRDEFLKAACQGDSDLRQEVDSLLQHHHAHTISTKRQVAAADSTQKNTTERGHFSKALMTASWPRGTQRPILVAGLLAVSIAVVGWWLHHRIRSTLRSNLEDHLRTVLVADVAALREWVAEKQAEVQSWASNDAVRREVIELVSLYGRHDTTAESVRGSAAFQALLEKLKPVYLREGSYGAVVVSRDGVNLFHNKCELVGREITPHDGVYLQLVLQGKTILAKPSLRATHVVGFPPNAAEPVMAVAAPVLGPDERVIAALAIAFDAREEFADLLTTANLGASAESFAIDDRGMLLSNLKHLDALRESGLLPGGQVPAMNLEVRDPQIDLTKGRTKPAVDQLRPLTVMATSVAAEKSGLNLTGYRNLLGQKVVGAWEWLPDYGFAVATEIQFTEAFAPLRYVRWAFSALYGILALLTIAILASSGSLARVQHHVDGVRRLGQYSLEALIGEGGMGKVYRARHALLQRPTAVKLFDGENADPDSVQRFEREVQLTSRLEHPNTIQIYDFGRTSDHVFYYAMELLDGVNLAQLVSAQGRLPAARVMYLLMQVCESLQEAHQAGLIHRDIKPANIMVCRRGGQFDVIKVLDFGLVKQLHLEASDGVEHSQRISGTPRYMAPERLATPQAVDARSDLYSLGAVAYYLLTGQEIFAAESGLQLLVYSVRSAAPRPSQVTGVDVPTQLDGLIHRCLAPAPHDRPDNVTEVLDALRRLAQDFPWSQQDAQACWPWNERAKRTIPVSPV